MSSADTLSAESEGQGEHNSGQSDEKTLPDNVPAHVDLGCSYEMILHMI
jgi:hypothetical protein